MIPLYKNNRKSFFCLLWHSSLKCDETISISGMFKCHQRASISGSSSHTWETSPLLKPSQKSMSPLGCFTLKMLGFFNTKSANSMKNLWNHDSRKRRICFKKNLGHTQFEKTTVETFLFLLYFAPKEKVFFMHKHLIGFLPIC